MAACSYNKNGYFAYPSIFFMKLTLTLTIIFISGILTLNAQKVENIKVTGNEYQEFMANNQYKFPSYTRAKIVLKNGEVASARINYNNFSEVMKYLNEKNDTLEIANPDDINFITVGVDTIFYDNGYYQWIASSSAARLYSKTTYKTVGTALVGAFGTASPATNIQHMNIISSYNTIFNLAANEVQIFNT
jgi:hypothetical protein